MTRISGGPLGDEQDETPCGSRFVSHDTCEPEPEIPICCMDIWFDIGYIVCDY